MNSVIADTFDGSGAFWSPDQDPERVNYCQKPTLFICDFFQNKCKITKLYLFKIPRH